MHKPHRTLLSRAKEPPKTREGSRVFRVAVRLLGCGLRSLLPVIWFLAFESLPGQPQAVPEPGGIGVLVADHAEGLQVLQTFEGGAADGLLREGDVIYLVEGRRLQALPLEEKLSLLRGIVGDEVPLSVMRPSYFDLTLRRGPLAPVPSSTPEPAAPAPTAPPPPTPGPPAEPTPTEGENDPDDKLTTIFNLFFPSRTPPEQSDPPSRGPKWPETEGPSPTDRPPTVPGPTPTPAPRIVGPPPGGPKAPWFPEARPTPATAPATNALPVGVWENHARGQQPGDSMYRMYAIRAETFPGGTIQIVVGYSHEFLSRNPDPRTLAGKAYSSIREKLNQTPIQKYSVEEGNVFVSDGMGGGIGIFRYDPVADTLTLLPGGITAFGGPLPPITLQRAQ